MCDFIANLSTPKKMFQPLAQAGGKVVRVKPYFTHYRSHRKIVSIDQKTAAASGVEIELMIPGIKASFFLDPVTNYYSGQLLEYGTKVYKYKGYIHAKTMVIDEELCCIGSVNMDMRSLMVDDEVCGVFYENQLVQKYNAIYDQDIENCIPYTWEHFRERNKKERVLESIFLPFAPLM